MLTSEASQRIQLALAGGQLDECLDQFDAAWHGSSVPSMADWITQFGIVDDSHLYQELVGELIKIDLEQRWRRFKSRLLLSAASESPIASVIGGLPEAVTVEDYRHALGMRWPFQELPIDLLLEEYRVRQRWGDRPAHSDYQNKCSSQAWPELLKALTDIDAELQSRRIGSTVRSNDSSRPDRSTASSIDLRVGDEIDDFRLLSVLGEGSFAKVFLAQQKSMQRLVALKISQHQSFESPVLSQLDHPNIVRVYDERVAGPYTLMYMQFVPGDSLRFAVDLRRNAAHPLSGSDYIRSLTNALAAKSLTPSRRAIDSSLQEFRWDELVAWLGSRLYAALAHAHECGVYHRDVKPENILVTSDGEPMLLDFNLSFGEHLTGSSIEKSFGGSLAYMSPEQLSSLLGRTPIHTVGAASDVYSLAIVLYELLFGVRPTEAGANSPEALLELRSRPVSWPPERDGGGTGLRENLLDALAIDPASRPTAKQLSQRLRVCFHAQLREIYYPKPNSWSAWIARNPLRSLIGFGLVPNACVSVLNIWANDRLTTHNFDRAFFDDVEKPVVNLIAYTAGVGGALLILTPVLRDLRTSHLSLDQRHSLASKTMRTPLNASLLILLLWMASGVAFPVWNQWSPKSEVGALDIAGFVISQFIHGLIAAVSTLAITSKVMVESILPKYYTADVPCLRMSQFESNASLLRWASSIMAITPLLAVFALAVSDQFDRTVFVVLAMVGFAGHLFTSAFVPAVLRKLQLLATLCNNPRYSE